MNQAEVSKLVSQLKINVSGNARRLKNIEGPKGRLDKLRKTVTALIKHERIELNYQRADEARGYAERLISDAIRHGDCHNATMKMADFWLVEKQLVHKLFKVLVPRYENFNIAYTRLLPAPRPCPGPFFKKAVLELRGNPYPPLVPDLGQNRNLLHNVLLEEARKEQRQIQYLQTAKNLATGAAAEPDHDPSSWAAQKPSEESSTSNNVSSQNKVDSEKIL